MTSFQILHVFIIHYFLFFRLAGNVEFSVLGISPGWVGNSL